MAIGIGVQAAGIQLHQSHMSRSEQAQAQIEQACVDSLEANAELSSQLSRFEQPSKLDALLATPSGPERLAQDAPVKP